MEDYKINMGIRLKEKRKMIKITQEQMAEKLNISVKHYGNVERGKAGLSIENLIEVCGILGTDLNYLILGKQECSEKYMPEKIEALYFSCPKEKRIFLVSLMEDALKLVQ